MTTPPPDRRLCVVRGAREHTAARARALVEALPGADVLWVGDDAPPHVVSVRAADLGERLGASFDVVVLDQHDGFDADRLGQAHGFVWGGGALVLRLWPEDAAVPPALGLAVWPFSAPDLGARFAGRILAGLPPPLAADAPPLGPAVHAAAGTPEQAELVEVLASVFASPTPRCVSVLADRGRGKSSALGLALAAAARRTGRDWRPATVTAATPESAAELLRFAGPAAVFVPLERLLADAPSDLVVVDEAAALPVPVLQRLANAHPHARLAFATTSHGYEGTGRGFVLRFLAWVRSGPRPLTEHTLRTPIRWREGDALEAWVMDRLALNATPAELPPDAAAAIAAAPETVTHAILDRDALAANEPLLRDWFGLLVHAHYRTTPGDLHRALDAPNLTLHALRWQGAVVAASLVAREGGLDATTAADVAAGRVRLRGHALVDTLAAHAGHAEACELRALRSVRIATHPALRRLGLARRLVDAVHAAHAPEGPDFFGTLFGATPELLAFREAQGYRLVRVGVSRGARSGEPSAVMVRPVSARAEALVASLRRALARALPDQLALQTAAGELVLDPALAAALERAVPAPTAPPSDAEVQAALAAYLGGPAPVEGVAWAWRLWLAGDHVPWAALSPGERRLIEARVLLGEGWGRAALAGGYPSVPAAMRALRPALRRLKASGTPPAPGSP